MTFYSRGINNNFKRTGNLKVPHFFKDDFVFGVDVAFLFARPSLSTSKTTAELNAKTPVFLINPDERGCVLLVYPGFECWKVSTLFY